MHRRSTWASDKHHLLAWILSLETARRHFSRCCLYTDDRGARLLVDNLGLQFDVVSTALNACADLEPQWWAAGKLYCYSVQEAPFLHLDTDVFLWKKLSAVLEGAPVLAQSPEYFRPGASYYAPERFEQTFRRLGQGWLPSEWKWYRRSGRPQRGDCCGVFGGTNIAFIRHYASTALRILQHPLNQIGLAQLDDKITRMVTVEQYFLSACVEFHRAHSESALGAVDMAYLFDSAADAHDPRRVSDVGYTHLIAGAKRNSRVADKLEQHVRRDYPEQYQHALSLVGRGARELYV